MIHYGYRLEAVTFLKKNASIDAEQFLEKFKKDYSNIDDLFQIETGLSIDEYCNGLNRLIELAQKRQRAADRLLSIGRDAVHGHPNDRRQSLDAVADRGDPKRGRVFYQSVAAFG